MENKSLILVIGDKNYSSWSMRPWLALKTSKLAFKEEKILLDFPNTRENILKHSPSGKVPVLQHGKTSIWDSLAICEYVSEISQIPLWPSEQSQRAHARSISAEMHSGFMSIRQQLSMDIRLQIKIGHLLPTTVSEIERILEIWLDCLKRYNGPFLFGCDFTIADAFYAPVMLRFRSYGIVIKRREILQYMDQILNYAPVQEWMEEALVEKNANSTF